MGAGANAMTPAEYAIQAIDLRRIYHRKKKEPFVALDGVSIEVRPGELFGLLGPNGAGKTTLIKIMTTLLAPTSGRAFVNGYDVARDMHRIRPIINMVSGGESCGYGVLSVRENLWLFSQLYGVTNKMSRERIDTMLEVVGLAEKAGNRVSHLSTGQRQKMNFCRGFITDPTILFLDEPTLGLDVNAARSIRTFVREWLAERDGRTMLLTTHYMQEADDLCDRLAIVDRGKILACDTPAGLKRRVQQFPVYEFALGQEPIDADSLQRLGGVKQASVTTGEHGQTLRLALAEETAVGEAVKHLVEHGRPIRSMRKVEPTLEDVFIELVGHNLQEAEGERS